MGLVLLRKDDQCFIGPRFTPFDPPTCVNIFLKKWVRSWAPGAIVNNCR